MCNVCVADQALAVGSCQDDKCYAWRLGHPIEWTPQKWPRPIPKSKNHFKLVNNTPPIIGCFVRARGEGPEFKPAEFQLRRPRDKWPKTWIKTDDLAGAMGFYGLDVKWRYVPKEFKAWLLDGARLPRYKPQPHTEPE